jgi:hypothetical protein
VDPNTDVLTMTFDSSELERVVALNRRRSAALYAGLETMPYEVMKKEKEELARSSPVRTGLLQASYKVVQSPLSVSPVSINGGAAIINLVPYFGFNLFGTGVRGMNAGVNPDLYGDKWHYSPTWPGMPPWKQLLHAWEDAPENIVRIARPLYDALLR